jgi:DNA-binding MarR family transcriptional regulator
MEEPRWLTPEQRATWLAVMGIMIRLPSALDAQLQRDAGLSHFEYQVLSVLSESPDRTMRMSDLAILANGSLSRLSHVVNRLEKRGWIERTPDAADGRYILATLTSDGWTTVERTAPGHVAAVRELVFDPLTGDQTRQLRDIGHQILKAIDPDGSCPK